MKEDARTFNAETQEQLRKQAIRLKRKGLKFNAIAEVIGVHWKTVSRWWVTYQAECPPRQNSCRLDSSVIQGGER